MKMAVKMVSYFINIVIFLKYMECCVNSVNIFELLVNMSIVIYITFFMHDITHIFLQKQS